MWKDIITDTEINSNLPQKKLLLPLQSIEAFWMKRLMRWNKDSFVKHLLPIIRYIIWIATNPATFQFHFHWIFSIRHWTFEEGKLNIHHLRLLKSKIELVQSKYTILLLRSRLIHSLYYLFNLWATANLSASGSFAKI